MRCKKKRSGISGSTGSSVRNNHYENQTQWARSGLQSQEKARTTLQCGLAERNWALEAVLDTKHGSVLHYHFLAL